MSVAHFHREFALRRDGHLHDVSRRGVRHAKCGVESYAGWGDGIDGDVAEYRLAYEILRNMCREILLAHIAREEARASVIDADVDDVVVVDVVNHDAFLIVG